ncbi:hypothetical protein LK994_12895 [Ferruginibacter lapsinanis]|uniref:hypothetical protein n=1 Tax=Ferruginibacter lapsinanis TaxID=563172 RepID=UPI001E344013|nr:hypothetical protein [Ferruginibacter lapsinanis]UEG49531.1 hypothetical protein LK994_12895 [Ferruginibacter lapsinanis]
MNDTESNIATNIETNIFFSIVSFLKENGWKLTAEYDENIFDKGIDFDLYQFSKNNETILLVWNNWFEGEMKATKKTLNEIETHFKIVLQFGEPEYLHKPDIINDMKDLLKFYK